MHMLMFVLDNPNLLDQVLDAWEAIGVRGVTILESSGINRRRAQRMGAPFMLGFHRLMQSTREGHYTLLTIIDSEEIIQPCIEATEAIVGDLDQPNTGIMAAWPVPVVKGAAKPGFTNGGDE
jgi:hypothetical protein